MNKLINYDKKPFILKYNSKKSLRFIINKLFLQAKKRQKNNLKNNYAETILRHLVGAKLELILPESQKIQHHGANVADNPTLRLGDFVVNNMVVHVTTAPAEALIRKCKANIEAGLRPIIVTVAESRAGIESIAKSFEIEGRIDIIEAEQFIATNILEWSRFVEKSQRDEIKRLVVKYNEVVASVETDPSLAIVF